MSVEKARAQVTASVWQAIAQSNVDLSTVPQEKQTILVGKITDSMLVTFDELMGDAYQETAPEAVETEGDEKILWQGRPFLSLVESYVITSERIKLITGMVSRHVENFELIRIQDIDFKQNVGERIFGLGDITIQGHDASDPAITLRNVAKPEEVYELIRRAWLEARKRYGLQFREYM